MKKTINFFGSKIEVDHQNCPMMDPDQITVQNCLECLSYACMNSDDVCHDKDKSIDEETSLGDAQTRVHGSVEYYFVTNVKQNDLHHKKYIDATKSNIRILFTIAKTMNGRSQLPNHVGIWLAKADLQKAVRAGLYTRFQ